MSKHDLFISPPIMNAAGSLGFAPDVHGPIELQRLGAFVTNPISQRARSPAKGRRFASFPGGFMIHTGYPNPGFRETLRRNKGKWERSPTPVIVHLLAESAQALTGMVMQLEMLTGVVGVEISLPPDVSAYEVRNYIQAGVGELPLIIRVPLERVVELASLLVGSSIAAISIGPPRGVVMEKGGDFMCGRLYGPGVFPQALYALQELVRYDLPVIGAGGVYSNEDIEVMLESGAFAVQLDSVLWRGGW